jgi:hypothetical protein
VDIVAKLHDGELDAGAADALFDDRIQGWAGGETEAFLEWVGMSSREYSAFLHGASVADIASLRYQGWPEWCFACGRGIEYPAGFWFHSRERVACVDCGHGAQDVIPWARA